MVSRGTRSRDEVVDDDGHDGRLHERREDVLRAPGHDDHDDSHATMEMFMPGPDGQEFRTMRIEATKVE